MSDTNTKSNVIDTSDVVTFANQKIDISKQIADAETIYPSLETINPIKLAITGIVSEMTQLFVWELMRMRQRSQIAVISTAAIPCQHDVEIGIRQIMWHDAISDLITQVNPRALGFSADMAETLRQITRFDTKKSGAWKEEIKNRVLQRYSFFQTMWCQFSKLAETRSPDFMTSRAFKNIKNTRIEQVYDIVRNHLMMLSSNLKYASTFSAKRFEGPDEIYAEIGVPPASDDKEMLMASITHRFCNPGSYRILKVRSLLQMEARLVLVRPNSTTTAVRDAKEYIALNPVADLVRDSIKKDDANVYLNTVFAERKCILFNADTCPYIYDTPVESGVGIIRLQ